jgi:hypothetical protein
LIGSIGREPKGEPEEIRERFTGIQPEALMFLEDVLETQA